LFAEGAEETEGAALYDKDLFAGAEEDDDVDFD